MTTGKRVRAPRVAALRPALLLVPHLGWPPRHPRLRLQQLRCAGGLCWGTEWLRGRRCASSHKGRRGTAWICSTRSSSSPSSRGRPSSSQTMKRPAKGWEATGCLECGGDARPRLQPLRSRTAVAPLERLKILLQVQNPHSIKYNGTVRGLFKGIGTNCARIVPNSAVKFFSYEQTSRGVLYLYRQQTGDENAQLTPILRLGAGACAGIIAMSATYPMDMVRGRITVQTDKSPYQYRGMFHALGTVYREEGFRALYRGWLPSVIGVVPYVGLNFAVYESLKDWILRTNAFGLADNNELHVVTRLGCGAVAGTIGQTVAYPLDVVRRRMQMVGWNHAASIVTGEGKEALQYNGMIDAFRKTVRHEGFGALYKGLVPNSVKVVPSIAIAFVTYEAVKDVLGVEMRID